MSVAQLLASGWGVLAGIILLPFIYLRDVIDVCQAVRDHPNPSPELHAALYVFRLEWWVITATAILLAGVLLLGEYLPTYSAPLAQNPDALATTRGLVHGFGFGVALVALYYVRWQKALVFRHLTRQTGGS